MDRRGARAEDFVACLKAVWGPDPVEHHGEFYAVPRSRVDPKPVQTPHPPLLLGGVAEAALRRAGRIADGWISSSRTDLTTIGTSVDLVRAAAVEAGRDPGALRFVVRGVVRLTPEASSDAGRVPLQGSADQIREDLAALERQGVTEVFLDLNWDPRSVGDDVDPAAARDNAEAVLESLAPR
jgi:alkanesulfonate monooxygenase SsuD/methylene tetrahydromethanopterin reductase-like flavin-dependent oxidoreductase (luciferase family)